MQTDSAASARPRWVTEAGDVTLLAAALLGYYFSLNLLVAGLCTLTALYLLWRRLDLGLIAVILAAPFYRFPKTLDLAALTAPLGRTAALDISLAEYTLGLCALAWLARLIRHPAGALPPSPLREPLVWLPPVVLIGVAALSLAFTENRHVALRELRVIIIGPALYYLMLVDTLRRSDIVRFMWALVVLGLGMGVYALLHYFLDGTVEATGGVGRALAIYHSPNALALFLGRVIPIAGALGLAAWFARIDPQRRGKLALVAVTLIATAAAFYITYSRGALIGLGAAGLVLLFGVSRRAGFAFLGAGLVATLTAVLIAPDRLLAATPLVQRFYVWEAALAMVRDYPLTGVGMDSFLYYYPEYMLPQAALEPNISHPHNLFLDFWTRLGILGLVTLGYLQGCFWWRVLELLQAPISPTQRWLVLGLAASMTDFLIHGLIDNSYFLIDLAFMFWLTLALATVTHRSTEPAEVAQ